MAGVPEREWAHLLAAPDLLRARGWFVAEGRLVLGRVLATLGRAAIVQAMATPAAAAALQLESRIGDRLVVRTPAEMQAVTGFNFHRGVLAIVSRPTARDPRAVLALERTYHRRPVYVVTEHLVDVDNVGSCFRNALAFGAAGVLLDDACPDPLYRKAVRTSLGAVLQVPWTQAPIEVLLGSLRDAGVHTMGLTPRDATPLADACAVLDPRTPVALVVGNEGAGLTPATLAACTSRARIPMAAGADSLNVATAVAVSLYEIGR